MAASEAVVVASMATDSGRSKGPWRRSGARVIDQRTLVGKALTAWRSELIADLGGPESVTAAQRQVIDLALRTKLIVDSVDAWILERGALVNGRRRAVYPVVLQRQQLADGLARYLGQLGLERRTIEPKSLDAYLKERYGGNGQSPAPPQLASQAGEAARERPSPPSDSSPGLQTPHVADSAPDLGNLGGS